LSNTYFDSKFNHLEQEFSDKPNSIDEYIENNYKCDDMSDSEYLSDESLREFIKKIDAKSNFKRKFKENNKHSKNETPILKVANPKIPKFKNEISVGSYLKTS